MEQELKNVVFDKQMAKAALGVKYVGQRPVQRTWVEILRQKMDSGRWGEGPQAIVFNTKGELIDGQHRLLAFIATKNIETLVIPVIYNAPEKSYYHLDQGRKRSTADATGISTADAATLNSFLYGPTHNHRIARTITADPESMLKLYNLVGDSLNYLRPLIVLGTHSKSFFTAPFRAVLLRAHLNGHTNLDAFIQQVKSGEGIADGENSVIKYRDFILSSGGKHSPAEVYQKTQNALACWMKKRAMRKQKPLEGVSEDLFPMTREITNWFNTKVSKTTKLEPHFMAELFDFNDTRKIGN